MENVDCHVQDHIINIEQFEQIEYFHAGKSKKKLSLNDKSVTLKDFVQCFHEKIETFAGHRFNLKYTDAMIDNLLESLRDHEFVIVQDFSQKLQLSFIRGKSIKAISQLNCWPYYLSRLYFETSHGKSKSDGLGDVVK